jgi:hypothetical protein
MVMEQIEIENAILEIMSESDFFTESNPITYMIFLDRYSYMLDEYQIKNVNEIIENLKHRVNIISNLNIKKIIRNLGNSSFP